MTLTMCLVVKHKITLPDLHKIFWKLLFLAEAIHNKSKFKTVIGIFEQCDYFGLCKILYRTYKQFFSCYLSVCYRVCFIPHVHEW